MFFHNQMTDSFILQRGGSTYQSALIENQVFANSIRLDGPDTIGFIGINCIEKKWERNFVYVTAAKYPTAMAL